MSCPSGAPGPMGAPGMSQDEAYRLAYRLLEYIERARACDNAFDGWNEIVQPLSKERDHDPSTGRTDPSP